MPFAVPILRGRLRGRRWCPSSGGKILRVLGGTYEAAQTAAFERVVRPGDVVYDLGAHTGYYTLLAAELAGPEGRVIAFEPDPRNAGWLRRHVEINRCANVRVVPMAVAAEEGTARFAHGTGTGTGHLAPDGRVEVRTTTVDEFAERGGVAPAVMKIDVEGAEADVLAGAARVLERFRPVLFLSTHGDAARAACLERLRAAGYRCDPVDGGAARAEVDEFVCRPES